MGNSIISFCFTKLIWWLVVKFEICEYPEFRKSQRGHMPPFINVQYHVEECQRHHDRRYGRSEYHFRSMIYSDHGIKKETG